MATYTSNYGWTKPSGSDNVDISVLNNNLDNQDSVIHNAFLNMAVPFSELSTYAVDDIVLYDTTTYKCHTAVVTPGSWTGSTNWQVYKLSEGGGGGGTSDYPDLTNKPQINGVELSGNKTASQLGMANSNTFQGTIAEWNQLTTAEKKAYDHASIPDSIDGGVTFPANKVIMTGGGNVESNLASAIPRTANGTTISQLVTALKKLTTEQLCRCSVYVVDSGSDKFNLRVGQFNQSGGAVAYLNWMRSSSNGFVERRLDMNQDKYLLIVYDGSTVTTTEKTIASWIIYYQGEEIS